MESPDANPSSLDESNANRTPPAKQTNACTMLRIDHTGNAKGWGGRRRKWKSFLTNSPLVPAIVDEVLSHLPPVDKAATARIKRALDGISGGSRGSRADDTFADAGGRSGYLRKRMSGRAWYVGGALLPDSSMPLCRSLLALDRVKIASIGGASGADGLGFALLSYFLGHGGRERPNVVDTTVFEFEAGWKDSAMALHRAMLARRRPLAAATGDPTEPFRLARADHFLEGTAHAWGEMRFSPCDITQPLSAACNRALRARAAEFDLFVSSYVVLENKDEMLRDDFAMYAQLFRRARIGAAFIFIDSSSQLWPALRSAALRVEREARADGEAWTWNMTVPGFKNSIVLWKRPCEDRRTLVAAPAQTPENPRPAESRLPVWTWPAIAAVVAAAAFLWTRRQRG
jgi:hypothetical protein